VSQLRRRDHLEHDARQPAAADRGIRNAGGVALLVMRRGATADLQATIAAD
jgi:hypothetical protein